MSAAATLATATTLAQAQAALQTFADQYSLTIEISSVPAPGCTCQTFTTLTSGDLPALKTYGAMFIDEWAKYPQDWVAASKLRHIALVKNFGTSGTLRAAGPDPINETMYYDVGTNYSSNLDYVREVMHHEYDHLITYNRFGSYFPADPSWTAANPAGFVYGSGGASCYSGACPSGPHAVEGFVSGYATAAIEEDKAETYGYLMTGADYRDVQQWIKADSHLAAKVKLYEAFCASISPEMGGSYFADVNKTT